MKGIIVSSELIRERNGETFLKGWLEGEDGSLIEISSKFRPNTPIGPGTFVLFSPKMTATGWIASVVKPLVGRFLTDVNVHVEIHKEISEWKIEAKLEDIERYYCHVANLEDLEIGKKCFIIGRKGTGKTAISEHLFKCFKSKRFTQKLSFKNFPFNDLYSLTNDRYTSPNQYITLWKYVIYSSIAQMMCRNQNIPVHIRNMLSEIYEKDASSPLPAQISRWTGKNFSLQILGAGFEYGFTRENNVNPASWLERVEVLEQFIRGEIDDSEYLIIFDELDEDYKTIKSVGFAQYIELLTGLFKAVQDVRSLFPNSKYSIHPMVFLRDDIYELIQDSDKTKWSDSLVELDWDDDMLRKLLAYRISMADPKRGKELIFQDAWYSIFQTQLMLSVTNPGESATIYDYISGLTLKRPRDFIKFLSLCSQHAHTERISKITPETISDVEKQYSINYLRRELEDEITGTLPKIKNTLNVIAELRAKEFSADEFSQAYNAALRRGVVDNEDPENVIRTLFQFSVIGNHTKINSDFYIFRYMNKDAIINLQEPLAVHRGLFKSLQLA